MPDSALTEVRPEKILKDLEKLWIELGKDDSSQADPGRRNAVLRACAMTFLVALEQDEDAQAAGETLAELMHEYPSRAIVLRVDGAGNSLEARVLAQCWMPFGRRQQICCEQIEITASAPRLEEVPGIVMGVMVPDLPVVLWCRSARLYSDERFQRIFPLVDKLIVDSSTFGDASGGYGFVRKLSRERIVGDLAWTRLTRWREMTALLFDDQEGAKLLPGIREARVAHAGDEPPVAARYLAGWLASVLPERTAIGFSARAEGQRVSLSGDGIDASIREEDGWAILRRNDFEHREALLERPDCELLREELAILDRDPVFEKSLR